MPALKDHESEKVERVRALAASLEGTEWADLAPWLLGVADAVECPVKLMAVAVNYDENPTLRDDEVCRIRTDACASLMFDGNDRTLGYLSVLRVAPVALIRIPE